MTDNRPSKWETTMMILMIIVLGIAMIATILGDGGKGLLSLFQE